MQCFKKCPNCFEIWSTRYEFISDNQIELNGYKTDFEKLEYGLFFFTHKKSGCGSTMALEVADFKDLYSGTISSERKTATDECPRYCFEKDQLDRCNALCECAFAREIIQIIKSIKSI
jgi:hypothetical protein